MMEIEGKIAMLEMRIAELEANQRAKEERQAVKEELTRGIEDSTYRPLEGASGRAFEYGVEGTDCKFINCRFMFGRRVYTIGDQTANADGTYYLVIPHNDPESASVVASNPGTDDMATCIPLIEVQDGRITADYRGMPCVEVYE